MKFTSGLVLSAAAAFAAASSLEGDADDNRLCHAQTAGYLDKLVAGSYVTNGFFDCFRTQEQIFELLDTLQKKHPTLITRHEVSKSVNGLVIPGYKVANGKNAKAIYVQATQHAREWASTSGSLYALAATLDDVINKKPSPLDHYDVVVVPIVNLDSYIKTWTTNRLIRTNVNGVDLNRNWPSPYWNADNQPPGSQTYPGKAILSEPETLGIHKWLQANAATIDGGIDVHSNAASVLFPFGDSKVDPVEPYLAKYKVLGKAVQTAIAGAGGNYDLAQRLYLTYGNFRDYTFRNYTKPGLTIEVDGVDFVVPVSTIRQVGKEVYAGLKAYSTAAVDFNGGTTSPTPTTTKPAC
ncbi:hypothetical protein DYB37_005516 [Aphanomyces astaci]|uniref:Peptidase M14 domain-containing protein n=1 Tax=Aphanomyces astaci TaxID=112090 RepID=A0A418CIN1_APHAT|nr:hypothetical protein DYB35_010308 [Aphanomyces astaci]RHZ18039.1 hypothetical protein DYB37_005516 [Aphanomyces astaci]